MASARWHEALERRAMLSSTPVILATIPTTAGPVAPRVAVDAAGDVFGTTLAVNRVTDGSVQSGPAGTVFEIPAGTGKVRTVASFGNLDGGGGVVGVNPKDILIDAAGNLFGDTSNGGPSGVAGPQILWELPAGGSAVQVVFDFASLNGPYPDVYGSPTSLSIDAAGDLFGSINGYQTHPNGSVPNGFEYVAARHAVGIVSGSTGSDATSLFANTASDRAGNAYSLYGTGYYDRAVVRVPAGTAAARLAGGTVPARQVLAFPSGDPVGVATDPAGDAFVTGTDDTVSEVAAGGSALSVRATLGRLSVDGTGFYGNPVADAAGNLFAVTSGGGAHGHGALVELPAGHTTFTVLMPFASADAYKQVGGGLSVDARGDLFGTMPTANGTGVAVFEFPAGTVPVTPTPPAPVPPSANVQRIGTTPGRVVAGLGIDAAGNVYGTTYLDDPSSFFVNQLNVFEIQAGTNSVLSLSNEGTYPPVEHPPVDAPFGRFYVDPAGTVVVVANGGNAVGSFGSVPMGEQPSNGQLVVTAPYRGTFDFAGFYGNLGSPGSLTADANGNLFGTADDTTRDPGRHQLATGGDAVLWEYPADGSTSGTVRELTAAGAVSGPIVADPAGDLFGLNTVRAAGGAIVGYDVVGLTAFTVADQGTAVGLALGVDGSVYITTTGTGAASGHGAILRIPLDVPVVQHMASVGSDLTLVSDPLVDTAGDVFALATAADGTPVVAERSAGATAVVMLARLAGSTNGAVPFAGLIHDAAGDLYAVTDSVDGRGRSESDVYKVTGHPFVVASSTPTPIPTPGRPATPAGLSPNTVRTTVPATAVAGQGVRGTVRVTVTNTTPAGTGPRSAGVVRVYASRNYTIDADSVLVSTSDRRVSLAAGRATTVTLHIRSPALASGVYSLLAQTTDAAGAEITAANASIILVKPPLVRLIADVGPTAPVLLMPGRPATVRIKLTNTGNLSAVGRLTFTLPVRSDDVTPIAPLTVVTRSRRVRAGRSVAYRVRFRVPDAAAPDTLHPVLTFTTGGATVAVLGTSDVSIE